MTNPRPHTYFNYFYIALVLLWEPLQGTILTVDGKGRTLFFMTLLSLVINFSDKHFRKLFLSKPIAIWGIWCVYAAINTYACGYTLEHITYPYFVVNKLICPLAVLGASAFEFTKKSRKFLKFALWTFIIYVLMGTFLMDSIYVEGGGDIEGRNSLGNLLALNAIMILFFASIRYSHHKDIGGACLVILLIFAIGLVVYSSTRKALGAGVILVIAFIVSQISWTVKSFLKLGIAVIFLSISYTYMMEHTQMGDRLKNLSEETEKYSKKYDIEDNLFLQAMADRAPQYILSTELFLKQPVTGVGLMNFQSKADYPYRLHTEYMVQLCECGLIGFLLFIGFYFSILKHLVKKFRVSEVDKKICVNMIGGLLALLFIYFTAWGYSMPHYFVMLGTIIAFSKERGLKQESKLITYENCDTSNAELVQ